MKDKIARSIYNSLSLLSKSGDNLLNAKKVPLSQHVTALILLAHICVEWGQLICEPLAVLMEN